jgi:ribonucleotide reductase beta subunit family protein with ferritin-like domain
MGYVENTQSNTEVLVKETLITPAFYTTNIRKLSSTDTSSFQGSFSTAIANLKNDYTKDKYIRDERFDQSWDHIQGEARELIIKLLEMYCAAEYSGFILYKELSYELKETNSVLSDGFSLMSRDEARHASFLNKAHNSIRKDLPVVLDFEELQFFEELDICLLHISENEKINISNQNTLLKLIRKIPHYSTILLVMLRLLIRSRTA